MSEQTPPAPPIPTPKKRGRRIVRILGIVAILLIALIVTAPWMVAHTGLRDSVINALVESPSVAATSESASFGWFSPPSVHALHLQSANDHIDVGVENITTERSPYQLWTSAPDLGVIRIDKPHVTLVLPLDVNIEGSSRLEPTFTAIAKHEALTVRLTGLDDPSIDVDDVDMTFHVEKTAEGRILTLDPVVLFDRQELSPKLADKLLDLFDPSLGDAPEVNGKFSLSLDKLRIPLGVSREEAVQRMEVEGKLVIHDLSGEVRSPLRQSLVRLVADMNGKDAPKVVRLAEDAEIHFQVRDGRLYHEGLRIGLPDIDPELQLTSRGSVGLDKSLDLFVELPHLDPALRKEKGPAKCRITGTIDKPIIAIEDASLVLRQQDRKEPIIAADGVHLSMRVENAASGRVLAVEPVEIFKEKKLSLGVAPGLLKLLAPDVQGEHQVDGEISLSFSTLRIPLGVPDDQTVKQLEAEGKLTLHHVSSEVKSPMWQSVIRLVADLNEKKSPDPIRLSAVESEIRFQVRDGRLHHEGLRIGFPEIDPDLAIRSSGSIGLDETLDLHLELPRLRKDNRDQDPLQCHITGTMSQPIIAVPDASLVVHLRDDDQAALTANKVNLLFSVDKSGDVPMLTLAPIQVFDKQKLTPEMGDQLLSLIDPTLTDLAGVQGTISLSFEAFRVPLGVPKDEFVKKVELSGKLHLHEVALAAETPMIQTLVKVLADMYGKKPSDVVRVVENAEVRFRVRDGRINHEDMIFGFPDISPDLLIHSSGSVGYDRTLDLVLDVPSILLDKAGPSGKKTAPVRLRVTGTIDKPVVTEVKGGKR